MSNSWKKLFFILLGINVATILFVLVVINIPTRDDDLDLEYSNHEYVDFNIHSNKDNLNKVINHYIEKEGLKSPIAYQVILGDEVELYGTLKVFTQDIEMKLTFEPEALENGDLILKQQSISIGQLHLPVDYVLKFIRDKYDFPEWVSIQPNEELIYVALQKMKLKSNLRVKVEKFDLKNDDIEFSLLVPTK
ncbi:YpmS family protein [Cytobacillus sp. FJAT-54145]|uniref:YpmS family protein n=1 Tax=Cytobacillus spartinae TaxID=3299023 RepID=A0ABW6KD51_9BACI